LTTKTKKTKRLNKTKKW